MFQKRGTGRNRQVKWCRSHTTVLIGFCKSKRGKRQGESIWRISLLYCQRILIICYPCLHYLGQLAPYESSPSIKYFSCSLNYRIPIILFDKLCPRVTISCLWKVEMSFPFYFISYSLMFLEFWDLGTVCISALSLLHHSLMREEVKSYIFLFLELRCLCSIPCQLFL